MLKKTILILLTLIFLANPIMVCADTSTDSFQLTIPASAIPPIPDDGGGGGGGGDNAAVPIAAGIAGGGAAAGILMNILAGGALLGLAAQEPCYICPVRVCKDCLWYMLGKDDKTHRYLKTAIRVGEVKEDSTSWFIFLDDSDLLKNGYKMFYFDMPEGTKSIKITQASQKFRPGELDADIFLSVGSAQSKIPTTQTIGRERTDGVAQKISTITIPASNNSIADQFSLLTIQFKTKRWVRSIRYAYVIEFVQ